VQDFKVQRSQGRCAATGREFGTGELFHVVLFRADDGFRREDYCDQAWQGPPEGAFCCFRSRIPETRTPAKRRLLVDDEVLIDFFLRLAGEDDPARKQFRFVLALILMRKRLVKYEETASQDGREVWRMRLMRDKSVHDVENPRLADDEIETVTQQLSTILQTDPDAADRSDDEVGPDLEHP